MSRQYFMIRAMFSTEKDFNHFFSNNIVAVGWSEVNYTEYHNAEDLRNAVRKEYYNSGDYAPQVVGKKLNEVERFLSINAGDYIVVPYWGSICLAVAEKEKIYDNSVLHTLDLSNQRKVKYLKVNNELKLIPRDALSEAFQRRLRVRGTTIADLSEFEKEITKLFENDTYTWTSDVAEKENAVINAFKENLLSNICSGYTNLKAGGIGLESLIKELFDCEGYTSSILAKQTFSNYGDADVLAVKADRFGETRILAQVKHHSGYTDDWGINQLKEIKNSDEYKDGDYKTCQFVLITSAEIGDDVRNIAEKEGITTFDGKELVNWIYDNISKLSDETKMKLGISILPHLFNG